MKLADLNHDEHVRDRFEYRRKLFDQKVKKLPLIVDQLKKANQKLSDAIWNNDEKQIEEARLEVVLYQIKHNSGEVKDFDKIYQIN